MCGTLRRFSRISVALVAPIGFHRSKFRLTPVGFLREILGGRVKRVVFLLCAHPSACPFVKNENNVAAKRIKVRLRREVAGARMYPCVIDVNRTERAYIEPEVLFRKMSCCHGLQLLFVGLSLSVRLSVLHLFVTQSLWRSPCPPVSRFL